MYKKINNFAYYLRRNKLILGIICKTMQENEFFESLFMGVLDVFCR